MSEFSPLVLVASQFEDKSKNPRRDEEQCNCACPDSGFSFDLPLFTHHLRVCHPKGLHVQKISDLHTLMFNPYLDQGVAIINQVAYDLWKQFETPQILSDENRRNQTIVEMKGAGILVEENANAVLRQGAPQTLSVWLHVANECNLRCDYCYINKTDDYMSIETGCTSVDAVVRSALNHGFKRIKLKFAGGEATMNLRVVLELHKYAQTQADVSGLTLDTVVLSNGVAIGEKAIMEFEKNGIQVSISLDGIGSMNDVQRKFSNGKGSFAWVDRTLNRLISHNIRPFISITLSDRNAVGLADVVSYVLDRDLPFNINFFRDNECSTMFADLRLRDEQIIASMLRAFEVIEKNLPNRSLLGALVDRSQFDMPHEKTCAVGESYLVIDHKGNVSKCQMEIEKPVTTIYAEDPLSLIRGDKIGIQNLPVMEKEGCRECEWRFWCAGGCPALTFRSTGRYDIKSPYCHIYKAVYPALLRLEGLRLIKLAGVN